MWYQLLILFIVCCLTYFLKKISSKEPNKIKFYSVFCLFYGVTTLVALILFPFFLLRPKNVRNSLVAAQILKHVTKVIEVKWHLRDGKILAQDRGAVVVANHQSSIDILGMFNIWHVMDKVSAIARKEVFYFWPFGLSAYLAGVVFIDRNNPKDAYKQLQITSDVMVKNKTKIWVFPEGTRNKYMRDLLPFKKGAFNIAVAAQVPIIPVVFSPYYFVNRKQYIFNPGHVIIQCLEPIPTSGLKMEDVPELIEKVRSVMETAYRELTKEVLGALPPNYPIETDN